MVPVKNFNYKNANLTRTCLIYGTPLLNFKNTTWWLLLALNIYYSFNFPKSRVVITYFTFLCFFCLMFPKNLEKLYCVYKCKQWFWQFIIICNSYASFLRKFSFHVVIFEAVLSSILVGYSFSDPTWWNFEWH